MAMTKNKYFLRYFAVFCVPVLLLGSLLWANNLWYTYREIAASRADALGQIVQALDLLTEQTQAVADKVNANADITGARRGAQAEYQRVSQWMNLYEDLFADDITLAYYMLGDSTITLRDGAIPYRMYEERYAGSLTFSLAGFFKMLNQSSRFVVSNLHRESSPYAVAYTYPVVNPQAKQVGTLAFLIPKTSITTLFNRYFPEDSARLTVLDAANKTLYTEEGDEGRVRALSAIGGIGLVQEVGQEAVLRAVSQPHHFGYYVTMSRADFYAGAGTDMSFLFMLQAVLILFSAAVAISLTRSHYSSLQRVQGHNLRLEDELDARGDIIRELVLRKLLDGSHKDAALIDYNLRCANIQYYHAYFYVIVADFTHIPDEDAQVSTFARAFEGRNNGELYCQFVTRPENRQAAVIVNTVLARDALAQEVAGWLAAQRATFPVGISGQHTGYLALNNAYVEAVVAIGERLDARSEALFLFGADDARADDSRLPMLERSMIQESIRNNNQALVADSVDAIFGKILLQTRHPQVLLCACYDVINLCIRLFDLFDVPLPSLRITELSDYQTPQQLCEMVKTLLCGLCETVQERASSTLTSTKYNLIGFVQANFRDSNLSLSLLADEFHLSQSYISKLFKDETGQNFISYVRQLRMSYVKKQLTETDLQVKDIILDTGYVDVANFARTFKQEVGVTPLQYRRNIRQGI